MGTGSGLSSLQANRPQSLVFPFFSLSFFLCFAGFFGTIYAGSAIAARGARTTTDARGKKGGETMTEAAREAAKEARRQYKRQWARKNREKVKAAQERYWAKRAAAQAEQEQEPEEMEGAQCRMEI